MVDERCTACGEPPRENDLGGKIPLKSCPCKRAKYHDQQCQRRDYKRHKDECRKHRPNQYFIEKRNGRGYCAIAARDLENDEYLQDEIGNPYFMPYVPPVLFQNQRKHRCTFCLAKLNERPQFIGPVNDFHTFAFCSDQCFRSGQTLFDEEVRIYSSIHNFKGSLPRFMFPTAILIYRLLRSVQQGSLRWDELETHQSHAIKSESRENTQANVFLVTLLYSLSGASPPEHLPSKIESLIDRIQPNAFTIMDSDEQVGFALFKTAHRLNHSCKPNVFQSHKLGIPGKLPALQLVTGNIRSGSELCISYVDVDDSTEIRRQTLLDKYSFVCICSKCSSAGS